MRRRPVFMCHPLPKVLIPRIGLILLRLAMFVGNNDITYQEKEQRRRSTSCYTRWLILRAVACEKMADDLPLSGLKVIDLTHYIAGPYCTRLLCGLGAEVIKVEKADGGDPARRLGPFPGDEPHGERSGLFTFLNSGKKSITLNLKTKVGVEIFKKLVQLADVVVENFEPRVMPRLGLDYESLTKVNPRLVMVSISNFGQSGPYRDYRATEMVVEALGGYMYLLGAYDREPVRSGIYLAQFYAGAVAAAATLAATYSSPEGQHLDISIMESVVFSVFYPLVSYAYCGAIMRRAPKVDSGELTHTFLPTADGLVYPMVYGYVDWGTLARVVLECPEVDNEKFDNPASRTEHVEELKEIMLSLFRDKRAEEIFHRAQAVGIPWGFVRRIDQVVNCPHLREQRFYRAVNLHGSAVEMPRQPFYMDSPWKEGRAPGLGEHNVEIYCGCLGYSRADLVKLRSLNVI